MAIHAHDRQRSIPEVFVDLFHQLTALLRNEGQLARVELSEKLDKLIGAGIVIGAGALLLLPGLVLLLVAFAYFLAEGGMSPAAASLVSGAVALALGAVLLMVGLSRLKSVRLVPNKTLHQIQQDVAVVKEVRHES
jgi:uncharacterized membrane protein YqjE